MQENSTSFLNVSTNVLQDINQVLESIHNQSQSNDVGLLVGENATQLQKLIPIAWVAVALIFLRFLQMLILVYRKSPIRISNLFIRRDFSQRGNTDVN